MNDINKKIADKAYQYFLARGGSHGYHLKDWLKAENEIRKESTGKTETKTKPIPATKNKVKNKAKK